MQEPTASNQKGKMNLFEIENDKEFKAVISNNGTTVGQLEGFISVDGKLIRKHIMYSAMNARNQAVSQTPPPGRKSKRVKINTQSMFNIFRGKKQKQSNKGDFVRSPQVSSPSRTSPASSTLSGFFK